MFLSPGSMKPEQEMFAGQNILQVFLLLLALVCVPWMLCTKPYLVWKEQQRIKGQGYRGLHSNEGHQFVVEDDAGDDAEQGHVITDSSAEGDDDEVCLQFLPCLFKLTPATA